ncbi:MAG: archease [Candidatus Thermoplasmatota archaeon]|nr:archease [Candidatus Thermoplasmatota archaeon]
MEGIFIPPKEGFTLGEHTADLWLEVNGSSIEDCVSRSLLGLYHVMAQEFVIIGTRRDSIALDNESVEFLVVDVLSEALFLFDSESTLMLDPSLKKERGGGWVLEFSRSKCRIPEGKGGMEVKAATFHGPGTVMRDGIWYSKVLLDI